MAHTAGQIRARLEEEPLARATGSALRKNSPHRRRRGRMVIVDSARRTGPVFVQELGPGRSTDGGDAMPSPRRGFFRSRGWRASGLRSRAPKHGPGRRRWGKVESLLGAAPVKESKKSNALRAGPLSRPGRGCVARLPPATRRPRGTPCNHDVHPMANLRAHANIPPAFRGTVQAPRILARLRSILFPLCAIERGTTLSVMSRERPPGYFPGGPESGRFLRNVVTTTLSTAESRKARGGGAAGGQGQGAISTVLSSFGSVSRR